METKLEGNVLLELILMIKRCIEKLENKSLTKVDSLSHNPPKLYPLCNHCKRTNHSPSNFFTAKTCIKYNQNRHFAKFCKIADSCILGISNLENVQRHEDSNTRNAIHSNYLIKQN